MALTELLVHRTPVSIGVVELDASVKEVHRAAAKASRHPIEADEGTQSTVSDNVHVEPLSVSIQGVVTNHPAEWIGTFDNSEKRAHDAHQELLDILLRGQLVTIKTSLLEYPDMILEELQIDRDADKGNALYLNATATMVRLVTLEEVDAAVRPVTQSTKSGGKKKAVEADTATSEGSQSALLKIFGG